MQPLNYSRQLVIFNKELQTRMNRFIRSFSPQFLDATLKKCNRIESLHNNSVKFILPDGGRVLDDLTFKALDITQDDKLRLPYPSICLEYSMLENFTERDIEVFDELSGKSSICKGTDQTHKSTKRVIYAYEDGDSILCEISCFFPDLNGWQSMPTAIIDARNPIKHNWLSKARILFSIAPLCEEEARIPPADFSDEITALMTFLNALQCSNVEPRKLSDKSSRKIKSAIPFDEYHILTIGGSKAASGGTNTGSNRSPREHLRRGHIRRLPDKKVWVNSCVVSAGNGGRIVKAYKL